MKKTVIARLFIKAQFTESFKKLAAQIISQTRSEKGCIFYSLFQDISNPEEFLFYEEYADQDALDAHFSSENLKVFRASVEHMHSKEKIIKVS